METVDIVEKLGIHTQHEMGRAFDASLFFPQTDYQKKHKPLRWKIKDAWLELTYRIDLALDVLFHGHECPDY